MAAKGKKKKKKTLIKLHSSAGTGYIYYTYKNPKNTEGKLEIMKFDPIKREHVKFVEKK